jgi:hypothetical protein
LLVVVGEQAHKGFFLRVHKTASCLELSRIVDEGKGAGLIRP